MDVWMAGLVATCSCRVSRACNRGAERGGVGGDCHCALCMVVWAIAKCKSVRLWPTLTGAHHNTNNDDACMNVLVVRVGGGGVDLNKSRP